VGKKLRRRKRGRKKEMVTRTTKNSIVNSVSFRFTVVFNSLESEVRREEWVRGYGRSRKPHSHHTAHTRLLSGGGQFRSTRSAQSGTVPCFAIHQRRVAYGCPCWHDIQNETTFWRRDAAGRRASGCGITRTFSLIQVLAWLLTAGARLQFLCTPNSNWLTQCSTVLS